MKLLIKILLLLYVLLLTIHLSAQRNYYDYTPQDKKALYFEDFNKETSEKFWTGKDREHKGRIKYGQYLYKSVAIGLKPSFIAPSFDLDTKRNFEIEALISSNGSRDYGLVWGQDKSLDRFYYFNLLKRGFLIKTENKELLKGKIKNLIDEWNKLTIRKVGITYYLFINEQLVYEMPYEPIENVRIGFGTPGWKVFVDYFGVYYLEKNRP